MLGSVGWKRGSYLKPQHGRVRRRNTARSTLSGSSVKTYRKASMHRKKPKSISYEETSHIATSSNGNSQIRLYGDIFNSQRDCFIIEIMQVIWRAN